MPGVNITNKHMTYKTNNKFIIYNINTIISIYLNINTIYMNLFSSLFHYVMATVSKYNIDESHSVGHAMNCLYYSNQIFEMEVKQNPLIKNQEHIIYVSAALHDMCDRKYMDKEEGLQNITKFIDSLKDQNGPLLKNDDKYVVKNIISTMSYSHVKTFGFPNLGKYQTAYNIVREADLLCAYDFDRCMLYNMYQRNGNIEESFNEAESLFQKRMFKHNDDGLFLTQYSILNYQSMELQTKQRIEHWRKMLKKTK